jgi:hypothetical protein
VKYSDQYVRNVLADPSASQWLKDTLRSALARDVNQTIRDIEILADILVMKRKEEQDAKKT